MFVNAHARVYHVPDTKLNKKAKMSEKVSSAEGQGRVLNTSLFTLVWKQVSA